MNWRYKIAPPTPIRKGACLVAFIVIGLTCFPVSAIADSAYTYFETDQKLDLANSDDDASQCQENCSPGVSDDSLPQKKTSPLQEESGIETEELRNTLLKWKANAWDRIEKYQKIVDNIEDIAKQPSSSSQSIISSDIENELRLLYANLDRNNGDETELLSSAKKMIEQILNIPQLSSVDGGSQSNNGQSVSEENRESSQESPIPPYVEEGSDSYLGFWTKIFLLITVILMIFIIASISFVLYRRYRDLEEQVIALHSQVDRRGSTIRRLESELTSSGFEYEEDKSSDQLWDTNSAVFQKPNTTRADSPVTAEVLPEYKLTPEPQPVDEGITIQQFVAEFKRVIYELDELEKFKKKWNVTGIIRKAGTVRAELGELVFAPSIHLNQVDFWGVPIRDGSIFIILPGRGPATAAATLVSDDGRPAEKLFRGIFDVVGGTMFELREPGEARLDGDTLVMSKKGKINLPANSR
jgi:hypothetical protein